MYDRETFSTTEYVVKPFRKLVNAFTLRIGDIIHLNIPVNGHVEGVDVLRLPADEALAYYPSFNPLMKLDYELSEI